MSEMILPGVYIEVRPEGLIVPGRVSVGTLGVVGTASKGPIDKPKLLGSYDDARAIFGEYDAWTNGEGTPLTLVRALELAFRAGATRAWAVRVSGKSHRKATAPLPGETPGEVVATLTASEEGTWGNSMGVNVWDAEQPAWVSEKTTVQDPGAPIKARRAGIDPDAGRNRVKIKVKLTGLTKTLLPASGAAVSPGKFRVNTQDPNKGALIFDDTDKPAKDDEVVFSYVLLKDNSRKVTLRYGSKTEVYIIADGNHLVQLLADPDKPSELATASVDGAAAKLPRKSRAEDDFILFGQKPEEEGTNGEEADATAYDAGLGALLNEQAHIMVAAGQDESYATNLALHCANASSDRLQKDRIAVVGSKAGVTFDTVRNNIPDSDRVIFVAPGIKVTDTASKKIVTLPGAYTAAVIAGMLSSLPPHVSLTNKPVQVSELETKFTMPQLEVLISKDCRVLAIEERRGLGRRVVQGITTSTNTAWKQITTRRIVDYAKYGVRSAAEPYIGLLNNERVRGALRATINSFLAEMVDDEMLTKYQLDVTATRDEERKGICRVTMTLQPTFSIDYIKVTMFLE